MENLLSLGVQILKHIRVYAFRKHLNLNSQSPPSQVDLSAISFFGIHNRMLDLMLTVVTAMIKRLSSMFTPRKKAVLRNGKL